MSSDNIELQAGTTPSPSMQRYFELIRELDLAVDSRDEKRITNARYAISLHLSTCTPDELNAIKSCVASAAETANIAKIETDARLKMEQLTPGILGHAANALNHVSGPIASITRDTFKLATALIVGPFVGVYRGFEQVLAA